MKKAVQLIIGILISILFIYLSFNKMDFNDIYSKLVSVNIKFVIVSTLISTASIAIRAIRWKYIIPAKKITNNYNIISANYVGFMVNNIFPAKFGDVTRAYMLGEKEGISRTSVFASVVIERLLDVISILAIFLVASLFFKDLNMQLSKYIPMNIDLRLLIIIIIAIFLIISSLYLFFLEYKKDITIIFLNKILKIFPHFISDRIKTSLRKIQGGIGLSPHNHPMLMFTLYTILYWLIIIAGIMLLFYSFDFGYQLKQPFLTALVITITSAIASSIPLAPANIGTLQFAVIIGLTLFDVNTAEAGAYSIISHASSWFLQVFVGLLFFLHSGMSLKRDIEKG